jgi:hypothetical protein
LSVLGSYLTVDEARNEAEVGWVARPSKQGGRLGLRPSPGPLCRAVSLRCFNSNFCNFRDRFLFGRHDVSPPHFFPVIPHAQQGGDKNTYPKIENIYGN